MLDKYFRSLHCHSGILQHPIPEKIVFLGKFYLDQYNGKWNKDTISVQQKYEEYFYDSIS